MNFDEPFSRKPAKPNDLQADSWLEAKRLALLAQQSTFVIGDVWASPRHCHFEVVHVCPNGVATMQKLGPGWKRTVAIRWNSPKLSNWRLLFRDSSLR